MKNQSTLETWNKVWKSDTYSEPQLRKSKAERKVRLLLEWLPLALTSESVVLDAGCGAGYVSEYVNQCTGSKVLAFDQSEEAIRLCNRIDSDDIEFLCCDALKIPFEDESVDIVLCIGLIEHIQQYDKCIEELRRVLKVGGYIYIVSSNKYSTMYLQWLLRNMIGRWKYGYQKNWSPNQLKKIMSSHSFVEINASVMGGWANYNGLSSIDCVMGKIFPCIGRYIVYLGKKPQ